MAAVGAVAVRSGGVEWWCGMVAGCEEERRHVGLKKLTIIIMVEKRIMKKKLF